MKKIISNFSGSILSREQLKKVVGGVGGCTATKEADCKGTCQLSNGNPGTCGWTVPTASCTCAGSGGGGIE